MPAVGMRAVGMPAASRPTSALVARARHPCFSWFRSVCAVPATSVAGRRRVECKTTGPVRWARVPLESCEAGPRSARRPSGRRRSRRCWSRPHWASGSSWVPEAAHPVPARRAPDRVRIRREPDPKHPHPKPPDLNYGDREHRGQRRQGREHRVPYRRAPRRTAPNRVGPCHPAGDRRRPAVAPASAARACSRRAGPPEWRPAGSARAARARR